MGPWSHNSISARSLYHRRKHKTHCLFHGGEGLRLWRFMYRWFTVMGITLAMMAGGIWVRDMCISPKKSVGVPKGRKWLESVTGVACCCCWEAVVVCCCFHGSVTQWEHWYPTGYIVVLSLFFLFFPLENSICSPEDCFIGQRAYRRRTAACNCIDGCLA